MNQADETSILTYFVCLISKINNKKKRISASNKLCKWKKGPGVCGEDCQSLKVFSGRATLTNQPCDKTCTSYSFWKQQMSEKMSEKQQLPCLHLSTLPHGYQLQVSGTLGSRDGLLRGVNHRLCRTARVLEVLCVPPAPAVNH